MAPQATNAAQLEATGATSVTFTFRGVPVTVPLDLDEWPLDAIRANKTGRAIKALLGRQVVPLKVLDDVVELSHRMADAVGVSPLPESDADEFPAFGAVPLLVNLVDNHADDIAADLKRFYGVDWADRWADTKLTLRAVWVYIRRSQPTSALALARNGGNEVYGITNHQLADIWSTWWRHKDGSPGRYPGRPYTRAELKAEMAKQAEAERTRKAQADREAYYSSGQNMRDAGVSTEGLAFAPPPSNKPPESDVVDGSVDAALEVAKRHARRSQQMRKVPTNDRSRVAEFTKSGRYIVPDGSGWG